MVNSADNGLILIYTQNNWVNWLIMKQSPRVSPFIHGLTFKLQ